MRKNVLCSNEKCEKVFEQYHGKHLYCSRACYRTATASTGGGYKKKVKRRKKCKLESCMNIFETSLEKQVFCSNDCYFEFWDSQRSKPDERECLMCPNKFKTTHHSKVYCSTKCYREAQQVRRRVYAEKVA